jgi:flagellar hook-basal body complex protein FliE
MSSLEINRVLAEMRALATQAAGQTPSSAAPAGTPDFGALMRASLDKVNSMQQNATQAAQAFEAGAPNVDIASVMIEVQKAGLAFKAMTEVRNKLVDAYREVMNMQM